MTDADFTFLCGWLKERSAIHLEAGKQYLVETRLNPLARQLGLPGVAAIIARLRTAGDLVLQSQVVEALVTTETSFFRDHNPYEALRRHVFPELIAARKTERRLAIWSAACSSGQEPYSLAIVLRESFPELVNWQVQLLATDLSREVLAKARAGVYSQFEANRGMPAAMMLKYMTQVGSDWHVSPVIRSMVEFREMNLSRAWPAIGRFDLILMRNVMIYFDIDTKKRILGRIASHLAPDGYLLLGGAETTLNLDPSYRRVEHHKTSFYQRGSRP